MCGVKDNGKKYGNPHSPEQPDVDAVNLFPTSQGCEAGKCHQADHSTDLHAGALRPVLVDDSIYDESKTVEKIDKRRESQTGQDKTVTGNASGDSDGSNRRWRE